MRTQRKERGRCTHGERRELPRQRRTSKKFIAEDGNAPHGQTVYQQVELIKETRNLYQTFDPIFELSDQNKLYELNRDCNALRKKLYEHYNRSKGEFDVSKVKLPQNVAGKPKHDTWIKLHGNAADIKEEINSLTKLWERRTDIDAANIKRVDCRGKYFNYCDVCFLKGKPQLKQCGSTDQMVRRKERVSCALHREERHRPEGEGKGKEAQASS